MEDFIFYLTGEVLTKKIRKGDFFYCYVGDNKGSIVASENDTNKTVYNPKTFSSDTIKDKGSSRWVLLSDLRENSETREEAITAFLECYLTLYFFSFEDKEFEHFKI